MAPVPSAGSDNALYLNALRKICASLQGCHCNWVITGSLGMSLHGMAIEVGDIDIQTDRLGAFEIESCLSTYVIEPVRYLVSEQIRSYLGRLAIDGIQIEIMGDISKRLDDQRWEEPIKVEEYRRWLDIDGLRVPVLSLAYEYQAYLKLGRIEKAEKLRRFLLDERVSEEVSSRP
ncbi:MAG: hypothetical protein IAE79_00935 [Anaerolinea sp.]|nr:hypothetical protein [Anaerolinea sp.]